MPGSSRPLPSRRTPSTSRACPPSTSRSPRLPRSATHCAGGRTIRRWQGYPVRVTAPLALHQATLGQCAALAGDGSTPAGRKAYRTYADRIVAAARTS